MNGLMISDVSIHRDEEGRFCLNELHRASGNESRHNPNRFTRSEAFLALASELTPKLAFAPSVSRRGGTSPGTYVVKELVYAYAMWISPAFHLKVIRAYDAMMLPAVKAPEPEAPNLAAQYKAAVPVATAVVELGAALGWTIERSQAAAVDVLQRKMGIDIGTEASESARRREPSNHLEPVLLAEDLSPSHQLAYIARRGPQLFRTQTELAAASGVAQNTIGRMYRFKTLGGYHGATNVQRVYDAIRSQEARIGNPSGQMFLPLK